MSTLTPWYRCGDAQPSRVGWYDTNLQAIFGTSHYVRRWWDGKNWRVSARGDYTSFGNRPERWPGDSWRGQVQP